MDKQSFTVDDARKLDADDPLAAFRDQFHLPPGKDGNPQIYFCGHSLGLQPKTTAQVVAGELADWQRLGVDGHFRSRHPWMPYHRFLTEHTAELVGALPSEVVNMNSLTVNLHLMMVSFFRPQGERRKLLIEKGAFPSDRYAVESQLRFHGLDPAKFLLEIAPRDGEHTIRDDDLLRIIDEQGEQIALILLPGVQYYTGQVFDMAAITEAAHKKGCLAAFDLAHTAGNIPCQLHDWGVDFAAWCSYKYLNSGPGSVAGCFVHERHASNLELPRFAGWWGHDQESRFEMGPDFKPMPGAEGWQVSNPPILALAPVLASLEIFHEAGMGRLRNKSISLTALMAKLLHERLGDRLEILTPDNPRQRGCQLSIRLTGQRNNRESRREVFDALAANDVICDWREPDVIRAAPVPLYNSHEDVWRFVERLGACL